MLLRSESTERSAPDSLNPFTRKRWLLNLRCGIVALKAVSRLEDIHSAIGWSYLKATNLEDGLLFNFASAPLTIKRLCRERVENASPDLLA